MRQTIKVAGKWLISFLSCSSQSNVSKKVARRRMRTFKYEYKLHFIPSVVFLSFDCFVRGVCLNKRSNKQTRFASNTLFNINMFLNHTDQYHNLIVSMRLLRNALGTVLMIQSRCATRRFVVIMVMIYVSS